ncbi:GNAT family N-acetyltransferase [Gillisia sp. JM1]|uniref:GNAT family N-acetyltransferase n=1 Tax=Gillisia sp. JM1 TaxID=1283286 RepID=UPI0004092B05|nr:GNAT family N-acetyltransferase [Gillisia sp. JM1]
MIEEAKWDSNFFGYPVGIIKLKSVEEFDVQNFYLESKRFKLVYVFCDLEINNIKGLNLVDKKVVFSKKISKPKNSEDIIEFDSSIHSYDNLLDLAYLSGISSRFKIDTNFTNNEFLKMYKEWLDKSIEGQLAIKLFIKIIDSKIAGFITFKKNNADVTQIGLVAVDPNFQGRNIGSELIEKCESASVELNFSEIEVATQYENQPAKKLYLKNNFSFKNVTNIYHFWNL